MKMRQIMNLVENVTTDVFPVPPKPVEEEGMTVGKYQYARIAYLGTIIANEMVGTDRSWNRATAVRKAMKIVNEIGGQGGYTDEAWLVSARAYIKTGYREYGISSCLDLDNIWKKEDKSRKQQQQDQKHRQEVAARVSASLARTTG